MTVRRRAGRLRAALTRRVRALGATADQGMATAEYAIVMVAAAALAGVLLLIIRSDFVRDMLEALIRGALGID
ncbi:hypothetical protein GCM10023169_10670 [Georgenia halophila]|uniref:DUF4244 domain-containing protein n=1 Tax=Georgenia halophila TaxID=620889 RepID=A0ABP8L1B6_9MICO